MKQSPLQKLFTAKHTVLLAGIVLFYLLNGIFYARAQSITYDEGSFYNYAVRYLKGKPERIYPVTDNSKMPVCALNTIPRVIQQIAAPGLRKNNWGYDDIFAGRYVTLLFSVLTLLFVYRWARDLYGDGAGLFAAFLFSFCPNSLASAGLVTTDAYSALFLLLTIYFLWKSLVKGGTAYFVLFAIMCALSQLVKQSLFHLYVLVPLILIVLWVRKRPPIQYLFLLKRLFLFLAINWLVICAGYYFYKVNVPLASYHFSSHLFVSIQQHLPSRLPVPLPKPFIEGLDLAKYYDQLGGGYDNSSFGKVTILSHASTGGSFWYYYFVTLLFKTPLSFLIFFVAAGIRLLRHPAPRFWQNEVFLLLPVAYYLAVFSLFYKTQCGVRHIIFLFPFFFIFCSSLIPHARSMPQKKLTAGLCIFLAVSVLSYWSNYYPYTNELMPDKKMAYAYVGAQNLMYNQGQYFLRDYMAKHQEVHPAPLVPQKGTFVIAVSDYLDVWNRHQYDWMKAYKPDGEVAGCYLIFQIR